MDRFLDDGEYEPELLFDDARTSATLETLSPVLWRLQTIVNFWGLKANENPSVIYNQTHTLAEVLNELANAFCKSSAIFFIATDQAGRVLSLSASNRSFGEAFGGE